MNDVCMLTASSTPNQMRSMPSFSATGPSSGTMMNDSSKKSRKNASRNTTMLTTIRKPSDAARQARQQMLDPLVAVDTVERQAEHAGADQDEDDERGELRRRLRRLLQQLEIEAPPGQRHDQCAGSAHGAAFGRRRHAQEDRAQHEEDQRQRRNQHERHPLRHPRQQPQFQDAVDDRGEECHADADAGA